MANSQYKVRKSIRLDKEAYMGGDVFHITIQSHRGRELLVKDVAEMSLDVLRYICDHEPFRVYAAMAMPNHLHVLCATDEGDNLLRHINRLKAVTTTLFHRQGYTGSLWRRRYYDHGLRTNESVEQTALYILENPVRKGLVDNWKQWPYFMVADGVFD